MAVQRNATSGPGAMSRRTDMAPQSTGQPTRVPTGQPYGEAKAMRQQQQAAPMESDDPERLGGATPTGLMNGAFGPTARPGEPITAGAPVGPGMGPKPQAPSFVEQDPDMYLRAMYAKYRHPDLKRLLLRRRRAG